MTTKAAPTNKAAHIINLFEALSKERLINKSIDKIDMVTYPEIIYVYSK
ncbi:MAG: hypothetical protein ABOJ95_000740 [Wolbachia endosymbiont of Armadillidium vulgare]